MEVGRYFDTCVFTVIVVNGHPELIMLYIHVCTKHAHNNLIITNTRAPSSQFGADVCFGVTARETPSSVCAKRISRRPTTPRQPGTYHLSLDILLVIFVLFDFVFNIFFSYKRSPPTSFPRQAHRWRTVLLHNIILYVLYAKTIGTAQRRSRFYIFYNENVLTSLIFYWLFNRYNN